MRKPPQKGGENVSDNFILLAADENKGAQKGNHAPLTL